MTRYSISHTWSWTNFAPSIFNNDLVSAGEQCAELEKSVTGGTEELPVSAILQVLSYQPKAFAFSRRKVLHVPSLVVNAYENTGAFNGKEPQRPLFEPLFSGRWEKRIWQQTFHTFDLWDKMLPCLAKGQFSERELQSSTREWWTWNRWWDFLCRYCVLSRENCNPCYLFRIVQCTWRAVLLNEDRGCLLAAPGWALHSKFRNWWASYLPVLHPTTCKCQTMRVSSTTYATSIQKAKFKFCAETRGSKQPAVTL